MTLETLVNNQKTYYLSHITQSYTMRLHQLELLYEQCVKYENELYDACIKDLGKPAMEMYVTEYALVMRSLKESMKQLHLWMKPVRKRTPCYLLGRRSEIITIPLGNTLIIGPFNYPFQLVMLPLIGAIAAGNTAIITLSPRVPHVNEVIQLILASYPEEYIAVREGSAVVNQTLISLNLDFIFFTGSTRVGKEIAKQAANTLTPVLLELGGKSPCIVTKNADVQRTAERIVWGKLINCGQTCVAPDYVLVHKSKEKLLTLELIKAIERMYGQDIKNNSDYGRIVNEQHALRLKSLIEENDEAIIYGGKVEKTYIQPTLIKLTSISGRIMHEEIFGPILPIIVYETEDEMTEIIKQNPNPLALYIFSDSKEEVERLNQCIPSGGATINETVLHLANEALPFGGIRTSGNGAYHGKKTFDVFSHHKSVLKSSKWVPLRLMYPPYTNKKFSIIKKLFR